MKKIISIILIAIMIITLAACGKEQADTEEVKTTLPVTEESVQEDNSDDLFFNEADYTVEQDEPYTYPNNDYKIEKTYKLKNKTENTLPVEITLDSEKITFNSTKVSDLTSMNWTLINGSKTDSSVSAHLATDSIFCSPEGKKAHIYAVNSTDNAISFNDCVVSSIGIEFEDNVYYDGLTEAADFDYADGITSESSPSDIINKLGNPYYIFITEHYNADGEISYSTITISYCIRHNMADVSFCFTDENNSIKMNRAKFSYEVNHNNSGT